MLYPGNTEVLHDGDVQSFNLDAIASILDRRSESDLTRCNQSIDRISFRQIEEVAARLYRMVV